jgi:2,4-dienoyl-CoA reductase-like NADH-dependent reductase (Old Yellow Enzyme family)
MLAQERKPPMLLQQPGQMGPLRPKNRVMMGPMATNFGTTDGRSAGERNRSAKHHDRIRLRSLCHPLCHP